MNRRWIREQVSALADGHLQATTFAAGGRTVGARRRTARDLAHLPPGRRRAALGRRTRRAATRSTLSWPGCSSAWRSEPPVPLPCRWPQRAACAPRAEAANEPVFRWKLVAGCGLAGRGGRDRLELGRRAAPARRCATGAAAGSAGHRPPRLAPPAAAPALAPTRVRSATAAAGDAARSAPRPVAGSAPASRRRGAADAVGLPAQRHLRRPVALIARLHVAAMTAPMPMLRRAACWPGGGRCAWRSRRRADAGRLAAAKPAAARRRRAAER